MYRYIGNLSDWNMIMWHSLTDRCSPHACMILLLTDRKIVLQTNRQTDGQVVPQADSKTDVLLIHVWFCDRQIGSQTDRQTDKLFHRQTDRQTDKLFHRQTDKLFHRQIDGQVVPQADRQTDRVFHRQNNRCSSHPCHRDAVTNRHWETIHVQFCHCSTIY